MLTCTAVALDLSLSCCISKDCSCCFSSALLYIIFIASIAVLCGKASCLPRSYSPRSCCLPATSLVCRWGSKPVTAVRMASPLCVGVPRYCYAVGVGFCDTGNTLRLVDSYTYTRFRRLLNVHLYDWCCGA